MPGCRAEHRERAAKKEQINAARERGIPAWEAENPTWEAENPAWEGKNPAWEEEFSTCVVGFSTCVAENPTAQEAAAKCKVVGKTGRVCVTTSARATRFRGVFEAKRAAKRWISQGAFREGLRRICAAKVGRKNKKKKYIANKFCSPIKNTHKW